MSVIDKIIKENKLKEVEEPKTQEEVIEKDERGNIIHYKSPNGYECWKEYDSNNNEIHHKIPNGHEYWKEYDSNNNEIHYKNSNGWEYWKEYDSNDNVTKRLELRHGVYYLNGKELKKEE